MAKPTQRSRTRGTGRRERIAPRGDTRFVRRDARGQFNESDDAGRSLRTDRRKRARTRTRPGQGDKGDRARSTPKGSRSNSSRKPKRNRSRTGRPKRKSTRRVAVVSAATHFQPAPESLVSIDPIEPRPARAMV